MPSFEEILKRPASDIQPPQALPVGTYHCVVDGVPEHGKSSQRQTDFLSFKFKILNVMDDVDKMAAAEQQVIGKTITNPFYITDSATWRLTEFLGKHLDIDLGNGKSVEEAVAEAPGKQVLVVLRHEMGQDGRIYNRVERTVHV